MTIEHFVEDDREELRAIFDRAGEGSAVETLWGHADSEAAVYLTPYLDHDPGSVLIARRGGRIIGYLTGCQDTAALPVEGERLERAVRDHRLYRHPRVMAFFLRSLIDLGVARLRRTETAAESFTDPRWPAHLHVAVIESARGTGVADRLVRAWLERLDDHGIAGCHLQTTVENHRAVRFFRRMGFTPYGPTPLIPGMRYAGRPLHQLTMVRPAG